jgi:hypothetical protein
VEIRRIELSIMENGRMRKEFEVDPGMADGTTPQEIGHVRECRVCGRLFSKNNVSRCCACGRDYCCLRECGGEVSVSQDERISVCAHCVKENNTGLLGRIAKKFWQLRI